MSAPRSLTYTIHDPLELNMSYMPFLTSGGLFIPTEETFSLNEKVLIELILTAKKETLKMEGQVVWITPANALHHALAGVGVQFVGADAQTHKTTIEALLDPSIEIGGYTYGIMEKNHL